MAMHDRHIAIVAFSRRLMAWLELPMFRFPFKKGLFPGLARVRVAACQKIGTAGVAALRQRAPTIPLLPLDYLAYLAISARMP